MTGIALLFLIGCSKKNELLPAANNHAREENSVISKSFGLSVENGRLKFETLAQFKVYWKLLPY